MPREREVKLLPFPTQDSLKQWKAHLISAVLYAADRTDEKAMEMVYQSMDSLVTFEDLAWVDPQMRRFDRKLVYALKNVIPKDKQLSKDIVAEDTLRTNHGCVPMTANQILRLMFRSFNLTTVLSGLNASQHLPAARWLGDTSDDIADYYRLMEELFDDLEYPILYRQYLYEAHMANSKDRDIQSDLSQYRRSRDSDRADYSYY